MTPEAPEGFIPAAEYAARNGVSGSRLSQVLSRMPEGSCLWLGRFLYVKAGTAFPRRRLEEALRKIPMSYSGYMGHLRGNITTRHRHGGPIIRSNEEIG